MFKFCPECGTRSNGAKFCPECGTKFDANAIAQAPIVPPTSAKGSSAYPLAVPAPASSSASAPPPPPSGPPLFTNNNPIRSTNDTLIIPEAATGLEAEKLYGNCISRVRRCSGNNEQAVSEFKANCRNYGLNKVSVETFHASMVARLGLEETVSFVPELVRLIPNESKRRELMEYNITANEIDDSRLSRSSSSSLRSSTVSLKSNPSAKPGVVKDRYADHPKCDICNINFEVTRRRHQCRHCGFFVCSSCSPARLLIPPGQEIEGAKGYDPSCPQRVCTQCAPKLRDVQNDLVNTYGNFNKVNSHETKGRIHVPYSKNLEKECCNAADIIGNFFRPEWGASADRQIPVAFLEKAQGVAIMTIVKAGFMITGKIGTGLVVARLPDGTWSAPSAIGTAGLGGGFEIGGELVELLLILGSTSAVKVFHRSQVNIGAGLDLTVGPYGRSAQAAAAASRSGLNSNYSYSQSKGLYAGISLQGAIIATRKELNQKFYGREIEASSILSGEVSQPAAAQPLYEALDNAMRGCAEYRDGQAQSAQARGACYSCGCDRFVAHTTQIWNKKCKTCNHVH